MIQYIKRQNLDVEKYNNCVQNSLQSRVYALSWYLDIAVENWDVMVLNEYQAVMPVPWKRKHFVKYVYHPLWILELGIFSKEPINEDDFLKQLFTQFKYVDLRMNTKNSFCKFSSNRAVKHLQFLSLHLPDTTIFKNYKNDRKKDINRSKKNNLIEKWHDTPENLITLFKNNVGKRVQKIKPIDYDRLLKLMQLCIKKKQGEILSIYTKDNFLVAAGFFIKNKKNVTLLVSATDFKRRKNGANTFLIHQALLAYKNHFTSFGFGGSSIKSIARFFISFGAKTEIYQQIHYNSLPKILRIFKP